MMINPRQMVQEVSQYLVDQDPDMPYAHWSEDELLGYFRLAVAIVASTQKNNFIQRVRIALTEGSVQSLPVTCQEMTGVIGFVGGNGKIIAHPRRTSIQALNFVDGLGCRNCSATVDTEDYKMDSWQYDETNPNIIYVQPPVPENVRAELEIACFVPPSVDDIDTDVNLGSQLRPAVFELMLYYAYGVDTESVPSRDRSTTHWNNAIALLGIDVRDAKNKYAYTRTPETRVGATKK